MDSSDCNGGVFVPVSSHGASDVDGNIKCQIKTSAGRITAVYTFHGNKKTFTIFNYKKIIPGSNFQVLIPLVLKTKLMILKKQVLTRFKDGEITEFYRFTDFSCDFMVPLYNTKSCVKCHTRENMITSNIIGGLRVTVPYTKTKKILKQNALMFAGAGICIIVVIIGFFNVYD